MATINNESSKEWPAFIHGFAGEACLAEIPLSDLAPPNQNFPDTNEWWEDATPPVAQPFVRPGGS